MVRICRRKSDNHILEMQSGGKVDRLPREKFQSEAEYLKQLQICEIVETDRLNTLLQNAINAGYNADEVEVFWATEEEYAKAQDDDPVLKQQKAEQVAEQTKVAEAKTGMKNLPGWADWSASQAEEWIEGNVTSLATAKTALKALAKAVIYLRDHSQITK